MSYCVLGSSLQYMCIVYTLVSVYNYNQLASNLHFALMSFTILSFLPKILCFVTKCAVHLMQTIIVECLVVYNYVICNFSTSWPLSSCKFNCFPYIMAIRIFALLYPMLKSRLSCFYCVGFVVPKLCRQVCLYILSLAITIPSRWYPISLIYILYGASGLWYRNDIIMFSSFCVKWSNIFSPHLYYRVMGHVEFCIFKLLIHKMLTEGFCSAVIKMLQNIIPMYAYQCILSPSTHTLCKTDMLWILSSDMYSYRTHQLNLILYCSLICFYVIMLVSMSIAGILVILLHAQHQVEMFHIILILKMNNVMENIDDTVTLMASLLLLLSGDVHPNPGPNINTYLGPCVLFSFITMIICTY